VQPCTITQHLVSVITTRETLTGTTTTEASLFPIQRIEYYPDALDMLAFLNSSTSEVNGPARLALARPVVDPQNPGLPDETTANSWVLLVPEGLVETALAWQNTRLEVPCSGQPTSLAIEWPIAEVLTFTQEMDPTDSLNAVDVARGKWTDPTDGGRVLYIDMLLVEELDQQGGKSWALYAFNVIPGAPGGPDRKTRFCCRWLGCKWATGYKAKVCRYWSCRRWMCNP
jgi:hypothetical protein